MEKINSLTGMTDLIETKADEDVLANTSSSALV